MATQPLPMEPGLYYRTHHKDAPFGREHARTQNIGEPPSPELAKYWEPKPGYSGFWNPHHLHQYHDEMGWDTRDRRVLMFRGTPVGEGADGEPRVMPESDKPAGSMSWRTFQNRLEVTPNGYGRWDEHTWGDGPNGQQVDDGYRTILGDHHTAAARPDDAVHLPDGSALVEGRECPECGQHVTKYKGTWWNEDDMPHDCDDNDEDLLWHFEAANQEGGEQPVIPASRLPKTHLDYTDKSRGEQFLDHLLSPGTVGNPDAPAFEHRPQRGWDAEYPRSLHEQLDRKRQRNIQRDLEGQQVGDNRAPGEWHMVHLTKDSTPEEARRAAENIARILDSGDAEEREIEHGLPERLTGEHAEGKAPAQTAFTVHPASDTEGFLRDRWHLSTFPSAEPLPPGTLRPSKKWVRRTWERKIGPLACDHPGCPPWEHREPRTAELLDHFDAAAEPEHETYYHLADPADRESIQANGLIPHEKPGVRGPGVFAYDHMPDDPLGRDVWEIDADRDAWHPANATGPADRLLAGSQYEHHRWSGTAVPPEKIRLVSREAADRPGRGEDSCSCCQGNGEHADGSRCERCDGSGRTGKHDRAPHCPGQPQPRRRHWRQGAAGDQFPDQPGLWYRAHLRDQPLDEAHARSRPLRNVWQKGSPLLAAGEENKYRGDRVNAVVGQSGYSSVGSPWHLMTYMQHFGWPRQEEQTQFGGRDVVAFHGVRVGTGMDREPLVMPRADPHCCGRVIHSSAPWEDFSAAMQARSGMPEHEFSDMLVNDKTPAGMSPWNAFKARPEQKSVQRHERTRERRNVTASADDGGMNRTFFHASPGQFRPGDVITPGHPRPDGSPSTHVYLSGSRDRAKYWAIARSNVGEPAEIHTYRVEPAGEVEPDPEDPGTGQDFRTTSPVRVVRKLPGSVGPRYSELQAEAAADYRQPHQGPDADDGEALHELGTRGFFPADVHQHPEHYGADEQTARQVRRGQGDPEARIVMYRAMPSPHHKINPGDWVTLSKEYALEHAAESDPDNTYAVLSKQVRARHLRNDGNDLSEWTYHGPVQHFPKLEDKGGAVGGWKNRKALSDAQWADAPEAKEAAVEDAAPEQRTGPDPTDWEEGLRRLRYRKRNEPEMHRGMAITLPRDLHDFVTDSQQTPDRQARAIADHLRTRGLGTHWSTDPRVSRDYARTEKDKQPGSLRVTVHARLPELEHIETDPAKLHEGAVFRHDNYLLAEREIPLKEGAPVHVTGITWYGVNGNRKRRGNLYGEQHIAVAAPAAIEAVAAFEYPLAPGPLGEQGYRIHDESRGFAAERQGYGARPQQTWGTLRMMHPSGESHGYLDYAQVGKDEDPYHEVHVEDLGTADGHTGKGIASALMDHLYSRHPEPAEVTHSMRTDEGAGWWDRYIAKRPEIAAREERQRARNEEDDGDLLGHFEAAGEYRNSHTAPSPDAGHLPLHHYTGGDPEDRVRIYRAAPAGTEAINRGDWVSLSADYAHSHGRHATDPGKDWPVYTSDVPQKHVHWDENDDNEHGYNGPDIPHPDVHDEETGATRSWEDYHDEHPHVGEGWLGGAVHLPAAEHEEAHDEFGSEDDRANILMNAARDQGALRSARWRDDLYPARDDAEGQAAQHREIPEGHRLTAFTVHRNDAGGIEDIGIHHYRHDHPETEWRRYQNIDLEGWHYRHPAIAEAGSGGPVPHEASRPEDYGMSHRPMEDTDQFHDLGARTFGQDVYEHPEYYGGSGGYGTEHIRQMRAARGKPDHPVTIYRAMHQDAPREINPGDWVAASKKYADFHAQTQGYPAGDWHVVSAQVPAHHIRTGAGSDLHEWGYWGPKVTDVRVHPRAHVDPFPGHEGPPDFDPLAGTRFVSEGVLEAGDSITAEAAAGQVPEYVPKPEWRPAPEDWSDDQRMAFWESERQKKHDWDRNIAHGLSVGHLTPGRAKELGYYPGGHAVDSYGESTWRKLPEEMYHVTTDLPGVRAHGLKTRSELGQRSGHGLGGGDDDTISVTTNRELAGHILHGLHEFHDVVNGRLTPQDMWDKAKRGEGADHPFHGEMARYWNSSWKEGDELPRGLQDVLHGREHYLGMGHYPVEEMHARHGAEWEPDDEGWDAPKGRIHSSWVRPMSDDEKRERAADFYKNFSAWREHAGGRPDPLFFGTDTKAFAAKDPRNFAILHVRPRPGAQGYPMGGMSEWRTASGDALEVHRAERLESGHLREASLQREADGHLANPLTGNAEWFHGTRAPRDQFEHGFHDPADMSPERFETPDGESGGHWSTFLGNHFAASHQVARQFAEGEHSSSANDWNSHSEPAIVHARLGLKNPKVYVSEHDLDSAAYEHAHADVANHLSNHLSGDPEDDAAMWPTAHALHWMYGDKRIPEGARELAKDPHHWVPENMDRDRSRWVNTHPDRFGIAERFKEHLQAQGHDGIVYGNEFEHSDEDHPHADTAAIAFDPRQIEITKHHDADDATPEPELGGHLASLEVTAMPDDQPPKGARFFHGRTGTYPAAAGDLLTPQPGGMRHMYYTTHLPTAARAAAWGHPLNERGYQDLDADALPGHVYEVVPETAGGRRIRRHAIDPDSGLPGAIDSYRTKGRLRVLHEVDRDTGDPLEPAEHTASLESVASDDDDDREPVDLYRGLYLGQGSAEDADELHRHPEGALQTQHGLGIHWTRNPNSAYNFATDRDPEGWAHEAGEDDEGTHSLGMILHARVHPRHIIEHGTPEWDDYSAFNAVLDPDHAEQETTVRDGAPIRLHKIYAISEHEGNQRETEHPQGNDHVAAVDAEPGGEVVAHFGAGDHSMTHFGATDWARFYDKIPGEIHRGLYAPESHGVFSAPMSDEDIAHGLIAAHQEEQFPYDRNRHELFGTHWTSDENVARGFAQEHEREHHDDDQCPDHAEHSEAAPVVFHAQRPQRHEIENDPRRLGWQNVDDYDSPEQEVPIRHGAPVRITGVSWLEHTSFGPMWHRHDLREPVHLRADDRDSPDDPDQWNGDRPEPAHHEAALDVVTHFGAIGAGPFFQQKLFHQQPDPRLHAGDSGRRNPDDPHAMIHHRQETEEGYVPPRETWDHPEYGMRDEESGLYRHPEDGGYHCHACTQYQGEPVWHDDAETAENHGTAATDWDEVYPHIPDVVHRGLWMGGAAHHLDQGGGLTGHLAADHILHLARPFGSHWTGSEAQARHYSGIGTSGPDRSHENLNVIIHARKPAREDIEEDPEKLADGGVYGIGYHDDEEIPLREGAPVHVLGVSWRRGSDPHGEWQHHEFPQPVERTAALGSDDVVQHFASADSDDYVTCDQGHRHWGMNGAAGLLIRHRGDDGQVRYLLQQRSDNGMVDHPGTWSIPGGAIGSDETPEEGARREAAEELGSLPAGLVHRHTTADDHGGWVYHTVVMDSPRQFRPGSGEDTDEDAGEVEGHRWVTPEQMRDLPLHPGFAASWSRVQKSGALEPGPDQRSAREERGDRWWEYQQQYSDDLHRGIHVALPAGLHDYVHDESVPREDRARALQQHFADSGEGLGMHWTPHVNIANRAVGNAADAGHGYDDGSLYNSRDPDAQPTTDVMFHVRKPGERNRLPQREHDEHEIGWGYSRDEDEFPLRPGSPLRLSGISWKLHEPEYPNEPYEHVDFPKAIRHVSSRTEPRPVTAALHPDASDEEWERHTIPPWNGEKLFHGTRSVLEPGDMLTHEDAARHANNPDIQTDPYVHATTRGAEAQEWGERASPYQADARAAEMGRQRQVRPGYGDHDAYRPRVYEVEPTGHVEPDPYKEGMSYRSAAPMRVVRQVHPLECWAEECEHGDRMHWPDHPHYEFLKQEQDEDEDNDDGEHTASLEAEAVSSGDQSRRNPQLADIGQSMLNFDRDMSPEDRQYFQDAIDHARRGAPPSEPINKADARTMARSMRAEDALSDAGWNVRRDVMRYPRGVLLNLDEHHRATLSPNSEGGWHVRTHPADYGSTAGHIHHDLDTSDEDLPGALRTYYDSPQIRGALAAQRAEDESYRAGRHEGALEAPVVAHFAVEAGAPGPMVNVHGLDVSREDLLAHLMVTHCVSPDSRNMDTLQAIHDRRHREVAGHPAPLRTDHEEWPDAAEYQAPREDPVLYPRHGSLEATAMSDGDDYVTCDQGHQHWGVYGAAGLLIRHRGEDGQHRYLLQRRSDNGMVDHPGTWSTPGGALGSGESPEEGARREAEEEFGRLPEGLTHHHTSTDDHGGWAYHTVVMDSPRRFRPGDEDDGPEGETDGHCWFTPHEMQSLPLHPGFAASWGRVQKSGALEVTAATRNHWDMTEPQMRIHLRNEHDIADPAGDPAEVHWHEHSGDVQRHVHPDLEREFVRELEPSTPQGDAFISTSHDGQIDPVFGSLDVVAHFEEDDPDALWQHMREAHGVNPVDATRRPAAGFLTGLHKGFHSGQVADRRLIQHDHGGQDDQKARQPADISKMFAPIPADELEERRRAEEERRRPRPERINDREYSPRDVSRHYDWEGWDPREIEHLVHRPDRASFTLENVPVSSLRHVDEHGSLVHPPSYQDIAGQDEGEQERLKELERGYYRGDQIPPAVVVRDGEHHIIGDGSHRAAVHAEYGWTHMPAFVTERTIHPGEHTAALQAVAYNWEEDEGPFTWDEIAARHPHVYGEGEDGDYDGPQIADAAAELYHDRPSHPYSQSTGELNPAYGGEMEFHPRTVDPKRIDYMHAEPGDPRVRRARQGYESQRPERVPPLILVHRHGIFYPADGHHRAGAADQAHKPVRAYVAYSPHDEPFAGRDGEPPKRGPFHGAELHDREPYPDQHGRRQRISYPGFPHAAETPPPEHHTAARQEMVLGLPADKVRQALPAAPLRHDDAIAAVASWQPENAAEARELIAEIPHLFRAIREGLLTVAGRLDEAPLDPAFPEALRQMAMSCLNAAEDARMALEAPEDGPEGAWETPKA